MISPIAEKEAEKVSEEVKKFSTVYIEEILFFKASREKPVIKTRTRNPKAAPRMISTKDGSFTPKK